MNKNQIHRKVTLIKAGMSQAEIGRMLGVSRVSINKVMMGQIISRRIANALCKLVNQPFDKFFPEAKKD